MGARADVAEDDGGASSYRGDGKVNRESRSDENQRRTASERIEMIAGKSSKSQAPSSREIPNYKLQMSKGNAPFAVWSLGD